MTCDLENNFRVYTSSLGRLLAFFLLPSLVFNISCDCQSLQAPLYALYIKAISINVFLSKAVLFIPTFFKHSSRNTPSVTFRLSIKSRLPSLLSRVSISSVRKLFSIPGYIGRALEHPFFSILFKTKFSSFFILRLDFGRHFSVSRYLYQIFDNLL